jgi:hypothetical protein
MTKITLILSFDHELSLGGTDSYDHNLFAPTYELLKLADRLGVRVALFTDILCAVRYEQWDRDGFFVPYVRQLATALRLGHDVQLHIHPHWVDSQFIDNTYYPSSSFALGDFANADPPNDVRGIVSQAYDALSDVCGHYAPSYRCVAYRAGGYNLSPATDSILRALFDKGVRIDSSIIKGYKFTSGISAVDFSHMPRSANWTIPVEGPLNAQSESGIFEVPIASKARTPFNNIPFLVHRLLHRNRAHDPGGRSIHERHTSKLEKLQRMFPRSAWPLGFDDAGQSQRDVASIFREHVRAHVHEREIICAAVSHPKGMGSYEFSLMESFVRRARAEYGSDLEISTYRDVYDARFKTASDRRSNSKQPGAV